MSMSIRHRRAARRYAQLLDEADGGPRQRVRTKDDADLAELVAVGRELSRHAQDPDIDPEFRDGLRAMLVATAEREGIGETATEPDTAARAAPGVRPAAEASVDGGWPDARARARRPGRRWPRTRTAVITGVTVGAVATAGMSAASDGAVPGDALYSVKRSTERAQLALANSDAGRGQLYLDFARTRLTEAQSLEVFDELADQDGPESIPEEFDRDLGRVLRDMDRDTTLGVRLLAETADERQDEATLDVIDEFVADQRGPLTELTDTVPADHREVSASLTLLDEIDTRAQELRSAIGAGCAPAPETDALGPVPQNC